MTRSYLFLCLIFFGCSYQLWAATIYVNHAATGSNNGSSWGNAYTNLQTAIDAANANDEIWVATGTYYPTLDRFGLVPTNDRRKTFFIDEGIELYGGFLGNEVLRNLRDPANNPTVLSGDIGTLNDVSDNTYHVIWMENIIDGNDCVLDGFTVEKGQQDDGQLSGEDAFGAGILITETSLPVINNCLIQNNNASAAGGGGLAIFLETGYNVQISNCVIQLNNGYAAGGLYTAEVGSANYQIDISGCQFLNNTAQSDGAGAYHTAFFGQQHLVTYKNCSFVNNNVGSGNGGAVYSYNQRTSYKNCRFISNASSTGAGGALYHYSSAVHHYYCLVNCTFSSNAASFGDDIYEEVSTSVTETKVINCIFGSTYTNVNDLIFSHVPNQNLDVSFSLFRGGLPSIVNDLGGNFINENPMFNNAAMGDFSLAAASPVIDRGLNSANNCSTDIDGNPRQWGLGIDFGAYESSFTNAGSGVLFVDADANGNDSGVSWGHAYPTLREALNAAVDGDEIWVAEGTYYPGQDELGNSTPADLRTLTFYINRNIKLYGGFQGSETFVGDAHPDTYLTVLSGDIDQDGMDAMNAYSVVTFRQVSNACVLDGFQIKDGNANGLPYNIGGGIKIAADGLGMVTSPIINNCVIDNNKATSGGGVGIIAIGQADPVFANSVFRMNSADSGGALHCTVNGIADFMVEYCQFESNSATLDGGAIMLKAENSGWSQAQITSAVFTNNQANAGQGGAIYLAAEFGGTCDPTWSNCEFNNNTVTGAGDGGSVYMLANGSGIPTTFYNCLFRNSGQNHLGYDDGLVDTQPQFVNCTLVDASGEMIVFKNWGEGQTPVDFINCISWNNTNTFTGMGAVAFQYSSTDDSGIGVGTNDTRNPLFTDSAAGDFTLQSGSPAINGGDMAFNPINVDLALQPRVQQGGIDRGAYESAFAPLPVSWLSFTAKESNGDAILEWTTAQEWNNDGFMLQRSSEGEHWLDVAWINGQGNSARSQHYTYQDRRLPNGTYHYRLRQEDHDGTYAFSVIRTLTLVDGISSLHVYPNPFRGTLNLKGPSDFQHGTVLIFDASGKQVFGKDLSFVGELAELDLSGLPAGVYMLRFLSASSSQTLKITKGR